MKSIKTLTAATLAAATILSLGACGSSTGGSGSAATSSDEKTEIIVWTWDLTIPDAAKLFEKKYPNIKVKVTNVGDSVETRSALSNALQAGSGAPDVVHMEYHAVPQYALADALEDITADTEGYGDVYQEGTWNNVHLGDKVYGLPIDSGPLALFYNKATFDKAGVTEPPNTWDEYYEAAKKIHALGPDYYIATNTGSSNDWSTGFMALLWQGQARPYTVDGENVTIDFTGDENTKKVLDFWQKMIDEGLINTKIAGWSDDWNRGLADGTIASLTIGSWMPNNLLNGAAAASGNFRVATMPQWNEGENYNGMDGGSAFSIVKGTKKRDAAWKFIDFVCHSREGIQNRMYNGAFPADKESLTDETFLKGNDTLLTYFGGQEYNKVLAEAANQKFSEFQYPPFSGQAQAIYGDYAGNAFQRKVTLDQAMADYQKALVDYGNQQGFSVNK